MQCLCCLHSHHRQPAQGSAGRHCNLAQHRTAQRSCAARHPSTVPKPGMTHMLCMLVEQWQHSFSTAPTCSATALSKSAAAARVASSPARAATSCVSSWPCSCGCPSSRGYSAAAACSRVTCKEVWWEEERASVQLAKAAGAAVTTSLWCYCQQTVIAAVAVVSHATASRSAHEWCQCPT
jgi:hypothetical protein